MKSLTIDLFILKKNVTNLEELKNNPDNYCIYFQDCSVSIKDYIDIENMEDGILSLDGGIIINYQYKSLTDETYWDDLPTLLAYMLNLVEDYINSGEASFYYPDQPLKVMLENQGKLARFSIEEKSILIDDKLLINSILDNSQKFFYNIVNELGLNKYQFELDQIKSIRKLKY